MKNVTFILGFTGVDQVYEKPDAPELVLKTVNLSIEESTMQVVQMLEENVSSYILFAYYIIHICIICIVYVNTEIEIGKFN